MVYKGISTIQKNREKKNYTQSPLRYCKKRYKQESPGIQKDFLLLNSLLANKAASLLSNRMHWTPTSSAD